MKQAWAGIVLYGFLITPPITALLESVMVLHMLIQLPLLILAGWLIGKMVLKIFPAFFAKWNANGIPGIILVVLVTLYWMLPRALDESLSVWYIELFKFISLPFLAGIALRDSWHKLKVVGKSFVFLNYLPMFGLLSWFYLDSPIQICNNYLEYEQRWLGWGFLFIMICMILYIVQQVFTDHSEANYP